MSFAPIPAIDVRAGRVVRLAQGDYARQTEYAADPLAQAEAYAAAGARWLHLVDLDAARAGGYTLLPLLRRIVAATGLHVQTGGGVRGDGDVAALLEAGAARVVVGSLAVREPQRVAGWLRAHGGGRLVLALDARCDADGVWRVPVHGWTEATGATLDGLLGFYRDHGAQHVLCTDIDRDGMLAGPNLALYRWLRQAWPTLALQASGGIRDAGDVAAVRALGCSAAILGRALLEGRLALAEVLAAEAAAC
ncbi:HisA/HisF-related TIM barrel protein [Thermomonas flagellata]|uniref:1-(5-phosphoribosyl)-5-[(5- phosphoribosylamino)methylideneamino]imidazole-4- carboxamide isomerase n=1 Tax=Thermomonas flagellata TaxID=2888524 RepID=UPI001F047A75|nr:HisA/HisF-related TIM barrel protein [Thermomonas flagellata]